MSGQDYEQLTLFQEDSLASLFPLPGSSGARQMTVTSGRKWLGLSKNCGRLGLLEKMLLESSGWHSLIYYLNWRPVDIGQGHFLFQLVLSEPGTGATGSQLWATPNTMDYLPQRSKEALKKQANGSRKGRKRPANLREQVNPETVAMWPTPRASMRGDCPAERKRNSPDLHSAVKIYNTPTAQDAKNSTLPASQINRESLVGDVMREMFATPQARDYRTGQASRWEDRKRSRNLNDQIAEFQTPTGARLCGGSNAKRHLEKMQEQGIVTETEKKSMQNGNGGQLNPDWVEWLMGFPTGWTEIP